MAIVLASCFSLYFRHTRDQRRDLFLGQLAGRLRAVENHTALFLPFVGLEWPREETTEPASTKSSTIMETTLAPATSTTTTTTTPAPTTTTPLLWNQSAEYRVFAGGILNTCDQHWRAYLSGRIDYPGIHESVPACLVLSRMLFKSAPAFRVIAYIRSASGASPTNWYLQQLDDITVRGANARDRHLTENWINLQIHLIVIRGTKFFSRHHITQKFRIFTPKSSQMPIDTRPSLKQYVGRMQKSCRILEKYRAREIYQHNIFYPRHLNNICAFIDSLEACNSDAYF